MNTSLTKTAPWYQSYHSFLQRLIANYGTADTIPGLRESLRMLEEKMQNLGFSTERITKPGRSDILVAKKEPKDSKNWIGLYGHYDVEPIEDGWLTDPKKLVEKEGRLYGRGTGDNLGPLSLRLIAMEKRDIKAPTPGLFWVLQGEEEIGSPFAHQIFPDLERPDAVLWLEETGYFEGNGDQRFLVMNPDQRLDELIEKMGKLTEGDQRKSERANRYMNKAFGQNKCPYLNHFVKDNPYLGIGPNDDFTGVHAPNESIPLSTLDLSLRQFNFVLDQVAKW
jgi:acetylornithine deacetylase/succinyl-diaminopimelate desuccinylase-like protein